MGHLLYLRGGVAFDSEFCNSLTAVLPQHGHVSLQSHFSDYFVCNCLTKITIFASSIKIILWANYLIFSRCRSKSALAPG